MSMNPTSFPRTPEAAQLELSRRVAERKSAYEQFTLQGEAWLECHLKVLEIIALELILANSELTVSSDRMLTTAHAAAFGKLPLCSRCHQEMS